MAKKEISVAGIGLVILQKRRGSRNLKLSITANGKVRVSQPTWAPFSAGAAFARSNIDWINKHLEKASANVLKEGQLLGKFHRIVFNKHSNPSQPTRCRLTETELIVTSGQELDDQAVQIKVSKAAEKALRIQSEKLLPIRLKELARQYNFSYNQLTIKKLTSRWGSCSNRDNISLSLYLIQLPWKLIDYVLLHELVHTVHKHHGKDFWDGLEQVQPGAKKLRKELHAWQPRLISSD